MPNPSRILLANVPRVHFYEGGEQSPEDIPFPSCLAAALRYLGEEYPWTVHRNEGRVSRDNYANIYILAHSGMAFGLRWREGWHMDNVDQMLVADPGEVIRRAFGAVGYGHELLHKNGAHDDEARFADRVRESLRAGRPVLAFGVVGPPECCLITGYDKDAAVVMGGNFFQSFPPFAHGLECEPTGQFRKRNWFADTWSMIVLDEKTIRPDLRALNRETLAWAIQVATVPKVFDHHSGHSAYTAWARQVRDDSAFAGVADVALREQHEVHNGVVGVLAECRWWGSRWLRQVADEEPDLADPLAAAAACYERQHDLMWQIWGAVGGNGSPEAWQRFAEPAVRARIADLVLEAREQDVLAVGQMRRALEIGTMR